MARRLRHPAGFLDGGDASNIAVFGLNGVEEWPTNNIVFHQQPNSVLILNFNGYAIVSNGEDTRIDNDGGGINISGSYFNDIINNLGALTLYNADNTQVQGIIFFRPNNEEEPFNKIGYLNNQGVPTETTGSSGRRTDYIDCSLVREFVYSGTTSASSRCKICAYDENKQFVRVLLVGGGTNTNRHFTKEDDYTYIMASAQSNVNHSLVIYYRNRGRNAISK